MGNLTTTIVKRGVQGNKRTVVVDVTGSSSYATNGDTVLAADIAKIVPESANLADVEFLESEQSPSGHTVFLDRANKKIKFFNGTTEIANAVNLSAVVVRCRFIYGGGAVPTG